MTAWVTLDADFLAHPAWLALQKADFILGPVLVGLYWRRRRPTSAFGPLLIIVGFACVPYALQSVHAAVPFGIGVFWEGVVGFACVSLILTFPNGRLDGRIARVILAWEAIALLAVSVVSRLVLPVLGADGSISGCDTRCPANGLFVAATPSLTPTLIKADRSMIIAGALATVGLLGWRFVTGTPPRRRAFLIGAPIAVFFELCRAGYHLLALLSPEPSNLHTYLNWTFAGARSAIWYGFLLALIAAELFAGQVLRRLVGESLHRPSLRDLESMLRVPLGDPGLRLGFWELSKRAWLDGDGKPVVARSDRTETVIERDSRRAAVLLHDPQLADDPELLQAAGAVALLALENTELEQAWNAGLRELTSSRARISAAGDIERRKLERDLHDGAQQRLVAALIELGIVRRGVRDSGVRSALAGLEAELELTLAELREMAHGVYPPLLADAGLVAALRAIDRPADLAVTAGPEVGRYPEAIESAVYFCCLEAMQNATKHAGTGAVIGIRLGESLDGLRFEVEDEGPGFDPSMTGAGIGLRNMRDRLEAVDGRLEIRSSPGHGTVVIGTVRLGRFASNPHPTPGGDRAAIARTVSGDADQ